MQAKLLISFALLTMVIFGRATSHAQEKSVLAKLELPSEKLQLMQGNWVVDVVYFPNSKAAEDQFPKEIIFAQKGAKVTIKGNELISDGRRIATIANELSLPAQQAQIGLRGFDLVMLILPTGKGILCSYIASSHNPNKIEFAYSHKTSCHRGSGHIISLKRVAP